MFSNDLHQPFRICRPTDGDDRSDMLSFKRHCYENWRTHLRLLHWHSTTPWKITTPMTSQHWMEILVSCSPVTMDFTRLRCVLRVQNYARVHISVVAGRTRAGLGHAFCSFFPVMNVQKSTATALYCLCRKPQLHTGSPWVNSQSCACRVQCLRM